MRTILSALPTVLLHSSGLSSRQWGRLAAALGERAIAPDLLGHGTSAPWPEPEPFSFERDVDQIEALLRARGPVHLVGHSYGGFLALQTALRVPEKIETLTLYDPVAFGALDRTADADARADVFALELRWGTEFLQTFVDYWGGPGAWNALREDARAEFRRVGWVLFEGVRTLMANQTRAEEYRGLQAKVQLITGELSPIAARRTIQRLAEALPGARVATIAGAGHMGPMTHGKQVNELVLLAQDAS